METLKAIQETTESGIFEGRDLISLYVPTLYSKVIILLSKPIMLKLWFMVSLALGNRGFVQFCVPSPDRQENPPVAENVHRGRPVCFCIHIVSFSAAF